jgi:hypothetical protein
MPYEVQSLNQNARAAEKQARRNHDRARLERGEITPEELQEENNFFRSLNLSSFKIEAIGRRTRSN